jgi:hypothetical protein
MSSAGIVSHACRKQWTTGRHLLPLEATTRQTLQEADSSNIDEVENTPVTYYIDGDEGYSLTLTMIPWLG